MLFTSYPSIAYLLVSCFCLCMYTYGVRTHGARAQSPRRKQKGRGCRHVDIVGKSGFLSHTKHIAEATNMNLFHS